MGGGKGKGGEFSFEKHDSLYIIFGG